VKERRGRERKEKKKNGVSARGQKKIRALKGKGPTGRRKIPSNTEREAYRKPSHRGGKKSTFKRKEEHEKKIFRFHECLQQFY